MSRRLLPFLAALLLAACGDDLTPEEFTSELPEAVFENQANCGLAEPAWAEAMAKLYRDPFSGYSGVLLDNETRSVEEGRMSFDADAAARCLEATRESTFCISEESATDDFAACGQVFSGRVAPGQPCYLDGECANGGECDLSALACPGQCVARKGVGEAAADEEECQDVLYVYAGKCAARIAVGQSCAPIAPATEPQQCLANLRCNVATQVCERNGQEGAACQVGQYCSDPFICVDATCQKLPGVGEACSGSCKNGALCDATSKVCQAMPSDGEACRVSCSPGLVCRKAAGETSGTCAPFREAGETCDPASFLVCRPGVRCDSNSKTCVELKGQGAACTDSRECSLGRECEGGVCAENLCPGT